jgi:hypothetical protein
MEQEKNRTQGQYVLSQTEKALMKKLIILLVVIVTLACYSVSNASITNAWWHDDGSGAVVCTNWTFSGSTLQMWGIQYGNPGRMLAFVQTTDPLDQALTLGSSITNDSGITWLSYQVNVIMSVPFFFVAPGPIVDNPPTSDWYVASVLQPRLQVGGPYNGLYGGTLYYNGGTPIGIGGELDYLYSIQFAGATSYSFTQEAIAYQTTFPAQQNVTITNTVLSGSALISSGTGGLAGYTFHVMVSTNVATPKNDWLSVGSGTFLIGGNFTVTNAVDATKPVQFFRLQVP